ncbi:MotB family protein [Rhizobium sp. KVB221]|uniref:MotB family protein n=1 Tax=Rhizobium setariae TaxID=2801340 RepID=A0A937CN31_9HYPH|nr:MotB family protein [Rhizobium setariae]MBL0370688.1 MotB family protein [Rhizobium setariae]
MSEAESHHHGKNEIIIVKRHRGGHEGSHGGAWKIAYADFMTAMMAFFLIMWLVNAANEETKAAVASYFNPIKLTDPSPAEKGLKKPAKEADGENEQEKSTSQGSEKSPGTAADSGKDKSATVGEEIKYSEADYFENPYSVIAEIAQETDDKANVSAKGDGGAQNAGPGTGAEGGEAFRDPFDPDFWTQQVEVSRTTAASADRPVEISGLPGDGMVVDAEDPKTVFTGDAKSGDLKSGEKNSGDLNAGEGLTNKDGTTDHAMKEQGVTEKTDNGKTDKDKNGIADKDKLADKDRDGKTEFDKSGLSEAEFKKLTEDRKAAKALEAELKKDLKGRIGLLAEGLVVMPAEGGLLISISDQIKTPMFRIGSSIPTRETVVAMARIGELLKSRKGQIAIRGHTDARPYKTKNYDNWRLSADRAQSAYFMLKSAGVAENRISQISGFADHRLRFPAKPLDEGNRRIEILIQADEG